MSKKITVTLTPEEAIRLGLMHPIAEQEILKPIGAAFMQYAATMPLGSSSFILTLLQVVYNAGRVEGIRSERNRRKNTRHKATMESGSYVSIVCPDDTAEYVGNMIADTFSPEKMCILGNELLIYIPENYGMSFSLNQLRNLVAPCRVEVFEYGPDESGESVRYWH